MEYLSQGGLFCGWLQAIRASRIKNFVNWRLSRNKLDKNVIFRYRGGGRGCSLVYDSASWVMRWLCVTNFAVDFAFVLN